jgi:hypothetical protein
MKALAKCFLLLALLYAGSAAAGDNWGAFAYDPTNKDFGAVADRSTSREAGMAALQACTRQHGSPHCRVIGTFANVCGALAIGDSGAGFSADENYQQEALGECRQRGDRSCLIEAIKCNHAYNADKGGHGTMDPGHLSDYQEIMQREERDKAEHCRADPRRCN